jgi:hypothetical protein
MISLWNPKVEVQSTKFGCLHAVLSIIYLQRETFFQKLLKQHSTIKYKKE